jgi:hypothetical protein
MLGPDDGESWAAAQRELHGWLNSTDANKGRQLFKVIGKPTNRASERMPMTTGTLTTLANAHVYI